MTPQTCIVCCVIAFTASGALSAKECRIRGDEALNEARANGFRFEAQLIGGDGTCSFSEGRFLAIASLSTPERADSATQQTASANISCVATGFAGRRISAHWKLKAMSIAGGSFVFKAPPQIGTDDLAFSIAYDTNPGAPIVLGIDFLTLEGADCTDWRRAFTEARPK